MANPPPTKRQKQVRTHNVATLIALLTFIVITLGATEIVAIPIAINALTVVLMFVAIVVMFASRNADEYTAAVWRTGTSLAFVITASVMLFTPVLEGFFDGLFRAGREHDLKLDGFIVVVATFFLGNAWARLRGTI
ncbi:hypothetical protein [Qipengyuania sp. JC766]|uniref:hypothetical protein n=1 Tax=Qipengyuania sp. JC766 TaxID=3232139 RepID=UPI00345A8399